MDLFLEGLSQSINISTILWIIFGSIVGIILGALPGLTATMGIALMMPLAFRLPTATGMGLLLAVYCTSISGASIPAILLGIPGNPNSLATVDDGLGMTKKGLAGQALGGAIIASFIGGIGSFLCLILFAPLVAQVTLAFGPAERTTLALVGLVIIASVSGNNLMKGLLMGAMGMGLALFGTDPYSAQLRIPFAASLATTPLAKGLDLISALIGFFGVSQVFAEIWDMRAPQEAVRDVKLQSLFTPWKKLRDMWKIILSSLGIGVGIGAIPGPGASIAVFMAHNSAKNIALSSKGKLDIPGSGCIEGVFAPEITSNALTGGALIPTLALGIPGDSATAVLMGALIIKGVTPGFQLFSANMALVYAIFITLFLANVAMLVFQFAGIRLYPKVLKIPKQLLFPLVLILSLIGAYAIAGQAITVAIYNMGIALVTGLLGYVLKRDGYPIAPIILGLILGSMFEENFRRAVKLALGDYTVFFTRPICLLFIALSILSILLPILSRRRRRT